MQRGQLESFQSILLKQLEEFKTNKTFFGKSSLNLNQSPLKELYELCKQPLTSLAMIAHFISVYKSLIPLENDNPKIKKLLQANKSKLSFLENAFKAVTDAAPSKREDVFRHYLAAAEEGMFARNVMSKRNSDGSFANDKMKLDDESKAQFPLVPEKKAIEHRTFHASFIDDHKKADPSGKLAEECKEFDFILSEYKIPETTLSKLQNNILECRLERLASDSLRVISQSNNPFASKAEFIRAIVAREIIKDFVERLIHEEKKYLWELNVWSKYRYLLDPEYSQPRPEYSRTLEHYLHEQYQKKYDDNYGHSKLLGNDRLIRTPLTNLRANIRVGVERKNLETTTEVKADIPSILEEIEYVKEFIFESAEAHGIKKKEKNNRIWKAIVEYSYDTKKHDYQVQEERHLSWELRLKELFETTLIQPLNHVDDLIERFIENPKSVSQDDPLVALIKKADEVLAQRAPHHPLQADLSIAPSEDKGKGKEVEREIRSHEASSSPSTKKKVSGISERKDKEKEIEIQPNEGPSLSQLAKKQDIIRPVSSNAKEVRPELLPMWKRALRAVVNFFCCFCVSSDVDQSPVHPLPPQAQKRTKQFSSQTNSDARPGPQSWKQSPPTTPTVSRVGQFGPPLRQRPVSHTPSEDITPKIGI